MLFSIHMWHLVLVTWKLSLISLECSLQTTRKQTVIDVATYISDLSRVEMQSVILFYFFSKFENFYLDANFLKSRTLLRYHSTCPTVRIFYRFPPSNVSLWFYWCAASLRQPWIAPLKILVRNRICLNIKLAQISTTIMELNKWS